MIYFCETCDKKTNAKRHFGIGTIIAVMMTFGWWILAMPFYRKRCVFCKGSDIKKKV